MTHRDLLPPPSFTSERGPDVDDFIVNIRSQKLAQVVSVMSGSDMIQYRYVNTDGSLSKRISNYIWMFRPAMIQEVSDDPS